jgi:hypothetical protein
MQRYKPAIAIGMCIGCIHCHAATKDKASVAAAIPFEWCDNTISKLVANFHLLVLVELPAKKLSSIFITKSGRSSGPQ